MLDHLDQKRLGHLRRPHVGVGRVQVASAELDQVLGPLRRVTQGPIRFVDRRAGLHCGPLGRRVVLVDLVGMSRRRPCEICGLKSVAIQRVLARLPQPFEVIHGVRRSAKRPQAPALKGSGRAPNRSLLRTRSTRRNRRSRRRWGSRSEIRGRECRSRSRGECL